MDDVKWSDSRRVDCTMSMHSPHDIILQAGIVYLSSQTTVDDTKWSNSRRVKIVSTTTVGNEPDERTGLHEPERKNDSFPYT